MMVDHLGPVVSPTHRLCLGNPLHQVRPETEERKTREMNYYVQYPSLCFIFWLTYSHIGLSFENSDTKNIYCSCPYFLVVKTEDSLSPFRLMVTHTMLGDTVNSDIGSLLVYRRTGARKTHEGVSNGHFT